MPPVIVCPNDVEAIARDDQLPAVFFSATAHSGTPPVTITCTPASGAEFPVGNTTVTCVARDSRGLSAACSFRVTVERAAAPRLTAVTFVAFGDSLTEGTTSPDPTTLRINPPDSYPFKLQRLLSERYTDQEITVHNEGLAGETIIPAVGRLAGVLDAHQPDVLLLLHGANNLLAAGRRGDATEAIPRIIDNLREMIRLAHARDVDVMLATFPPQDEDGSRGAGAPGVEPLNEEIANLAVDEGAVVVDLFEGLGGTPAGSIGVDGLHPTASGYTQIAQIWFEAIQREYEASESTAVPVRRITSGAPRW